MQQKISIFNGTPENSEYQLSLYLKNLQEYLKNKQTEVIYYDLSKEDIHYCVGCWDCWWKTPGFCRFKDSMYQMYPDIVSSSLVIYASPMIMGFYSALMKKMHDRTVPLLHPYIEMVNGESHHRKRYPNYPEIGILLEAKEEDKDALGFNREIADRYALNFRSRINFFYTTSQITEKDLANEISHI